MQIAIISGGMGAVGQAVAKRLASDGYSLHLLVHTSPKEDVEAFLKTVPGEHAFSVCDLSNAEQIQSTIDQIKSSDKDIGVCVHAATSRILRQNLLDIEINDLCAQLETDINGSFILLREVARIMREQKSGRIVGITTSATETNEYAGRMGGYVIAKQALKAMLKSFAHELARYNVTVNAVAPGFMNTPLTNDLPDRLLDFVKEENPMHRITTPEDVANAVAFLCLPEASSITGVSIPVTCGDVMNL